MYFVHFSSMPAQAGLGLDNMGVVKLALAHPGCMHVSGVLSWSSDRGLKGHAYMHVSSMLSTLMQGWLVLDWVIDVPVCQGVLAWDDLARAVSEGLRWCIRVTWCSQSQVPSICDVCLQCVKDVDELLIAKPDMQLIQLEIRHDWAFHILEAGCW
jgi:hypothetical protein